MDLIQTYETTVSEPGTGLSFGFVVVPRRSFPGGEVPYAHELARDLQLETHAELEPLPSEVFFAVLALLRSDDVDEAFRSELPSRHSDPNVPERQFAENVTFGDVVPFELSPLGAASIAGVLTKGGAAAAGAALGVAVGGGATPLLLITVPAGIILCGAAVGVAAALEQGLRTLLLRRLGVEEGQGAESSTAAR